MEHLELQQVTENGLLQRRYLVAVEVQSTQAPQSGQGAVVQLSDLVTPEQQLAQVPRPFEESRRDADDPVCPKMQPLQLVHSTQKSFGKRPDLASAELELLQNAFQSSERIGADSVGERVKVGDKTRHPDVGECAPAQFSDVLPRHAQTLEFTSGPRPEVGQHSVKSVAANLPRLGTSALVDRCRRLWIRVVRRFECTVHER